MVSEVAGRGARFSGKGGMPGQSMWDQGEQGPASGRGSMWDQGGGAAGAAGAAAAAGAAGAASGRSMWDQGAPTGNMAGQGRTVHPPQGQNGPAASSQAQGAVKMGPQGPMTGNIKSGTVKSYSVVKGFGFILAPEIAQDIYFGRDSLQADLRTSDVAGTEVNFELIRAPDGKPQARNLLPTGNAPPTAAQAASAAASAPSGCGAWSGGLSPGANFLAQQQQQQQLLQQQQQQMQMQQQQMQMQAASSAAQFRPTMGQGPVGAAGGCWPGMLAMRQAQMGQMAMGQAMGQGMGMGGCFPGKGGMMQGAINPAFMGKPGFPMGPPPIPSRPGFPAVMPGKGPGGIYMVRPGDPNWRPGMMPGTATIPGMGMMFPGRPMNTKRDWSPHAGSRAIKASLLAGQNPLAPAGAEADKKGVDAKSKSRSRSKSSRSSSSSSRSRSRSRKKKKGKKKSSKRKRSSSSSGRSISSSGESKKEKKDEDKDASASKDGKEGEEDPAVAKAKMEALERLRGMQAVEPKEERSKQFRALLREWHPDKNPDRLEVATAVFQFLQKGKSLLNLK